MSDLNNWNGTGRLTKDAVKKTFPSGTDYLTFDIANNTGYGEHAKCNYFGCILIGKRATSMVQYLIKGKLVALSGTLEKNDWTGQDGKLNKGWQLNINDIVLLGGADKKPVQNDLFGNDDLGKKWKEMQDNEIPF